MGQPGQQDTQQIRLENTGSVSVAPRAQRGFAIMRNGGDTCSSGTGDDHLGHVVDGRRWVGDVGISCCLPVAWWWVYIAPYS